MTDHSSRLQAALAGRYTLERKLGRGGMATVWLARDLKHDRLAALKLLHPELAAAIGPERFLREIRLTARLAHPHLLPLLDSGEADGQLYYVMPFVQGESLRDRLAREHQLPLEEALTLGREVADALAYAHSQDVVHRDIKPENILLQAGHAVVADFGIARAITAAGDKLTETGMAVGTPAYMSPEQAAGSGELDGRSDLYALGSVVYEMLAGRPPFVGPTAESVMRQHIVADPLPLTSIRAGVPDAIAAALTRALAKAPADRFQSIAQFGEVLRLPTGASSGVARRAPSRALWRWVASAAVLGAVAALAWLRPSRSGGTDPNLLAVFPFRTTGIDTTYGEGVVDLLSATLVSEAGPRVASPQSVIRAWERAAGGDRRQLSEPELLRLGQGLGAGRVVLGGMVSTPAGLSVQASLLTAPGGKVITQARATGPPDSLIALIDRIATQLLATWSGETGRRLASLAGSSPEALKAYLQGMAAYRRGSYENAVAEFNRALDLDSTFLLAALGEAWAGIWTNGGDRGIALAWAMQDRLSAGERALVLSLGADSSPRAVLRLRERAVEAAPDRPEAWFLLGDQLHHNGRALGVTQWRERSEAAFWRALEFDSTLAGPLEHLLESAAGAGDSATVRRVAARVIANGSSGGTYYRWLIAQTLGDTGALAELRGRFEGMDFLNRQGILAQLWRRESAADFQRVVALQRRSAASPRELRWLLLNRLHPMLLNAGRPQAWLAEIEAARQTADLAPLIPLMQITDALYWGGDSTAADAAARQLAPGAAVRWAADRVTPEVADERACVLAQWDLGRGRLDAARRVLAELRGVTRISALTCVMLLDALVAAREQRADARDAIQRLDSLMLEGDAPFYGNLIVARLREERGDVGPALAAARRGEKQMYLAPYLLMEGRLAAESGDRSGAIRAYEEYLAHRYDPEPGVLPEVERVREALAQLRSEGPHR